MAQALPGRTHVLFDSFEGLPPLTEEDPSGLAVAGEIAATEDEARTTMLRSGGDSEIRKGWFRDTLEEYATEGA